MRNACEVLGLASDDTFPLHVSGESHYQETLSAACGGRGAGIGVEVIASLQLENSPYDPEAVRVEVNQKCVGYLSRADARAYRKLLVAAGTTEEMCCRGQIRGGWKRGEDTGHYGIWLDAAIYGPRTRYE